ncbi:MAG: hypothetical protein APG12_01463 [Candidatus Methanofastidiosum methylothiophilum]|uniref:Uncharacterized protein n=1 Tax=Candidatus Methanofastidiosum methylothiophilum TaxID=1705564 RepID=A0A150IK31_9EURY|nr:MAG: hypothetical protein APG10_01213 [Candidatus Methanofastidiosum methylthiophilus]KYC47053.1 MAG: hypothetical protein APG11_01493 [Candidatus Methanofastidiosum methylthiophilus]KYC49442.1 MAG: hypothetical protein APG12_01463 [Candidatus Methanofastidiosum methylthiophilus]
MNTKQDYNKLLLFLYKELVEEKKDGVSPKTVVQEFQDWAPERINEAYVYLRDNHFLRSISLPSSYNGVFDFWIQELYPYAIKLVEDELESKKQEKLRNMLNQYPWEPIKLIKKDENRALFLDASIGEDIIFIADTKIAIKEGNIIERSLGNGLVEKYLVLDKDLTSEKDGIPSHYKIKVRKT